MADDRAARINTALAHKVRALKAVLLFFMCLFLAAFAAALMVAPIWPWSISIPGKYFYGAALLAMFAFVGYRVVESIGAAALSGDDERQYRAVGDSFEELHSDRPSFTRPLSEERKRELRTVLDQLRGSYPPRIGAAIEDWLASADDPEKDRKQADLLARMYRYSTLSEDGMQARAAVNRLRQAINPWGDD